MILVLGSYDVVIYLYRIAQNLSLWPNVCIVPMLHIHVIIWFGTNETKKPRNILSE